MVDNASVFLQSKVLKSLKIIVKADDRAAPIVPKRLLKDDCNYEVNVE